MPDSTAVFAPGFRILDANGEPVPGAKLNFFDAGTSNPKTVYADSGLASAIGVTVYADDGGYPVTTQGGSTKTQIYVGTSAYKLIITDADDATIATHDNIVGAVASASATEFAKAQEPVLSETSSRAIASTDYGKLINANPTGSGTIVLTLPEASVAGDGTRVRVRHSGASGSVSIKTTSAQTIDGPQGSTTSYSLVVSGDEVLLISTGAGWVASAYYVKAGSITADKLSNAISGAFVQTGSIISWPHTTTPTGYLDCDGSAVSRTTYSELFDVIGTSYGSGDGSTTFNLPDYRGMIWRMWDNGAGVDPDAASRTDRGDGTTGDAVGTRQAEALKDHNHGITNLTGVTDNPGGHQHGDGTLQAASAGTHSHTLNNIRNIGTGGGGSGSATYGPGSGDTPVVVNGGAHTHTVTGTTSTAGGHTHATTSNGTTDNQASGGNETRMANVYVRALIFAGVSAASGASSGVATLLHGSGPPNNEIGANNDFYIDVDNFRVYGPKANDAWDLVDFVRMHFEWKAVWALSTGYLAKDIVRASNGNQYLCIADHTSTAADEPAVGASWETYWELYLTKGNDGATGPSLGQDFAFNSGTTDANPGSGNWRLNNATPGSATFLYISKTDRNGGDLSNIIDQWDASTSTTIKGNLKIVDPSDTAEQFDCQISGTLVDATDYFKVPISNGVFNGSGSNFTDSTVTSILFTAAGDAGSGLANAYYRITDGSTTAESSGPDTFKLRTGTGLTVAVTSNDATHGDNALISLSNDSLEALRDLTGAADKGLYFTSATALATYDLSSFGRTFGGLADAAAARTNLGLVIGTDVQAYDADLAALAALSTQAYGLSLLETANEAALKTLINLEIGTDVQAYDADLQAISGLSSAADRGIYYTGSGTADLFTLSSFARTFLDDASAGDVRATLGLAIGADVQAYDAELAAFAGLSSNGFVARTASGTAATRTLQQGDGIAVSNGNGVSGNPSVAMDIGSLSDRPSFGSGAKIPVEVGGSTYKFDYDDLPGSGGGISNGYANITDGSVTANASGADTFKVRSSSGDVTATVANNDATHGDNVDLGLSDSGVSAGSYTLANVTVDAKGRITSASNGEGIPDGTIVATLDATPQSGYVELDGATISGGAATYPNVAARYPWMVSSGNIVLPDFRGRALRGFANGSATDPDRASRTARAGDGATGDNVGTYQADEYESHTHGISDNALILAAGSAANRIRLLANNTYQSAASGGNETRMKNIAVMFVMKMG
ncbi:MAG: tail fiber protein [Filomicrobium sp.]